MDNQLFIKVLIRATQITKQQLLDDRKHLNIFYINEQLTKEAIDEAIKEIECSA